MPELFISYCHEDRDAAAAIAAELARLGVDVWWDHELLAGDNYRTRITEILNRARGVIVLWSRRSVERDWVISEASDAKERKLLIPVSIDGEKPPIDFRQLHTIELKSWTPGDPLTAELIRAISGRLGRDLVYEAEAHRAGRVARLARQAASGWYLDFESLLFYLIGQGFACFLCEIPIPTLARRLQAAAAAGEIGRLVAAAPYAMSLTIGVMVAALYMRPVLEHRRLTVAIPVMILGALLSLFAYLLADAVTDVLGDQLLMICGLDAFIFILVTAVADRANRQR